MEETKNLYWGIMHCHILGGICHKKELFTPDELNEVDRQSEMIYDFAINDRKFDFLIYADHHSMGLMIDHPDSPESPWEIICEKVDKYNQPGSFAAFRGYEYQDGMEYNVYLHNTDQVPNGKNWQELIAGVKHDDPGVILAAHNRPNPTDWKFPLHPNFRMIEMTNEGGVFEAWVNEGVQTGNTVAFVGGSDDHSMKPGRTSCTGVYSEELSDEAIWEAFWNRRTICATGIRPELYLKSGDTWMGSVVEKPEKERNFEVYHKFEQQPYALMLIKNGSLLAELPADSNELKLEYKDTDTSGQERDYYYIKVIYKDGNAAYTSPIYFINQTNKAASKNQPRKTGEEREIYSLEKVDEFGSRCGRTMFTNASDLVHNDPNGSRLHGARDMIVHVGPESMCFTSRRTLVAPRMDGIYECSEDGSSSKKLYAFSDEEFRLVLTSIFEVDNKLTAMGYLDAEEISIDLGTGTRSSCSDLVPVKSFFFGARYVTPAYANSDGKFLYILRERECSVKLPDGQDIGFCQEEYPAFPVAVAAENLSNICILGCDGELASYDLSASQNGKLKWKVKNPEKAASVIIRGQEVWVFNNRYDNTCVVDSAPIYIYDSANGKLKGVIIPPEESMINIRGQVIAAVDDDIFALCNPNKKGAAAFREILNETGIICRFKLNG